MTDILDAVKARRSTQVLRLVLFLCFGIFLGRSSAQAPSLADLRANYEQKAAGDLAGKKSTIAEIALLPGDETIALLEEILAKETAPDLRRTVFEGFAKSQSPRGFSILKDLIQSKVTVWADRYAAVDVIDLAKRENLEFLGSILKSPDYRESHYAVTLKLARAKKPEATAVLREAFAFGDDQQKSQILANSAGQIAVEAIWTDMIAPNITPQAPVMVRQAAIRCLAVAKDERFFSAVRNLLSKETNQFYLTAFIRDAAFFDSVEAMQLVLSIIGNEPKPAFAQPVEETAEKMQSKAVREWFRSRGALSTLPMIRMAALRHFAKRPEPADGTVVVQLTQDKQLDIAREAVLLLAKYPTPEIRKVVEGLVSHKDPAVVAAAVDSIITSKTIPDSLKNGAKEMATKSRVWELRVVGLGFWKKVDPKAGRTFADANLKHPRRQVREAAFDLVAACADRNAVEWLIERLEKDDPIDRRYLADLLCSMTDFDWGEDAGRWRKWWATVPEAFALRTPDEARKKEETAAKGSGYGSYYGLVVNTERPAFLVDCSGSMSAKFQTWTRMEAAKANLVELLRKFDDRIKFMIIAFDTALRPFDARMTPAKPAEVERAVKWVQGLAVAGATNIYDALERAMDTEEVETIYLLTDGAPSAGKFTDVETILQRIRTRNQFLRIKINTIDIGGDPISERFLKRLAEENNGRYTKAK